MKRAGFKNRDIIAVGNLYLPENFNEQELRPAIAVCHPAGGVKEQTAGTYAAEMAKQGYVTVAYDASYQGESSGEPRQMENPHIRVEDVSAAVDFLTTLPYVENNRTGHSASVPEVAMWLPLPCATVVSRPSEPSAP